MCDNTGVAFRKDRVMAIKLPEGTKDLLPDEAAFWNEFKDTARRVFGAYGYRYMETPLIEQTSAYRGLPSERTRRVPPDVMARKGKPGATRRI